MLSRIIIHLLRRTGQIMTSHKRKIAYWGVRTATYHRTAIPRKINKSKCIISYFMKITLMMRKAKFIVTFHKNIQSKTMKIKWKKAQQGQ